MLKRNIIANYLGQIWVAIMGLAFVPVYVKYMGIDAYGLIGLYGVLQACLALMDMGMTPMLGREMARFTGGAHTNQSIRDTLRSVEVITFVVAFVMASGVMGSATWLAKSWVHSESLDAEVVSQAFMIMGFVIAVRFVEGVYRSALIGLQHQVLFNVINAVTTTFRWGGAACVVVFFSPTVSAFFLWQLIVSLGTVILLGIATYQNMPESTRPAKVSIGSIKSTRQFAGGMFLISITVLVLTNLDKVILSALVPLSDFGYYTLTVTAVGGLTYLSSPIIQAVLPKMAELHQNGNVDAFSDSYHSAAQLVSIVMGSATWVAIFFSEPLLDLWTGNEELVQQTSDLLKLMALGTLINGMMGVPYIAQLAVGQTKLTIITNVVAIIVLVPALFVLVPIYGVYGAAMVWIALNVGYMTLSAHYVYKRIMLGEKLKWYVEDVFLPLAASSLAVAVVRLFYTSETPRAASILLVVAAGILSIVLSSMAASRVRGPFMALVKKWSGS